MSSANKERFIFSFSAYVYFISSPCLSVLAEPSIVEISGERRHSPREKSFEFLTIRYDVSSRFFGRYSSSS